MQIYLFQEKTKRRVVSDFSVLSTVEIALMSLNEPFKNCFFIYCNLVGLMDTSLIDFQSSVFRGPIPQVEVLKVEGLDVGPKGSTSQEETEL